MFAALRIAVNRRVSRNLSMATEGVVHKRIITKLTQEFQPSHLEVINESFKHNVPKGSETHFLVVIVSSKFSGLSLIKRHRSVNEVLQEELSGSVHALSIQAKTPEQWLNNQSVNKTPLCLGGSGK